MGEQVYPSPHPLFSLVCGWEDHYPRDCGHPPSLCLPSPLTTEEVVDDGVGGAVGIHQPVGEGKASVDGFSVAGLAEHPKDPRTRRQDSEKCCPCVCVSVVLLIELKLQGYKVQEFLPPTSVHQEALS